MLDKIKKIALFWYKFYFISVAYLSAGIVVYMQIQSMTEQTIDLITYKNIITFFIVNTLIVWYMCIRKLFLINNIYLIYVNKLNTKEGK